MAFLLNWDFAENWIQQGSGEYFHPWGRRHGRLVISVVLLLLWAMLNSAGQDTSPGAGKAKHVIIDKGQQVLIAYEGDRVVFECHVSTGRGKGWTPNGDFHAGIKSLIHYSSLFHNAPMPYSVQVNGNIFIHGFAEVPPWPASHGCIRVPVDGDNPARHFFNWVEMGTPIRITGEWNGPPREAPVLLLGPLN